MARADVRNNKANGIVRSDVSVVFVLQSESFKMPNFENFLSDAQMFSHFEFQSMNLSSGCSRNEYLHLHNWEVITNFVRLKTVTCMSIVCDS